MHKVRPEKLNADLSEFGEYYIFCILKRGAVMKLSELIKARYSCRSYKNDPVSNDLLKSIFEAARFSHSASNRQEWRFVVVTDREKITRISDEAGDQGWWKTAPVIVACCADTNNYVMPCRQAAYTVDLSIIMEQIILLAAENGLASCWLGAFNEDVVKDICGMPKHIRIVGLITMGYPADAPKEKSRLRLDQILFRNRWEEKF
jgi:nitroreductase